MGFASSPQPYRLHITIYEGLTMLSTTAPLLGWAFNDVLNELHQLIFEDVPGESEPFELSLLER